MKKHILTSTLLLSLGTATAITIGTTVPLASKNVVVNNKNTTNDENVAPFTASTAVVKFRARTTGVVFTGATDVQTKVGRQFVTVSQPVATKDGYVVTNWQFEDGTTVPNDYKIPVGGITVYAFFEQETELKNCVGIAALQDSKVSIVSHGQTVPTIRYSTDGSDWKNYTNGQILSLESGQVLYFKGDNKNGFSKSETDYTSFSIGGSVNLNGNAMTLLNNGIGTTLEIPNNYCFYRLFENCSGIVSISSNFLPATKLTNYAYAYMFEDCTRLTDFPQTLLPAEVLDQHKTSTDPDGRCCYAGMFMNCTGLKNIPTTLLQHAKTLSTYCYYGMFQGCTGLTRLESGILPATTLTYGCYYAMFSGCTNIETIANDLLPATTLAERCYANMFSMCYSLTDLSQFQLNVQDLTGCAHCYEQMFYSCYYKDTEAGIEKGLTKAPALPAAKLSESCYSAMFYNCSLLVSAPSLPATTMTKGCYQYMFYNCSSLATIPTLASTSLAESCYADMFHGCTSFANSDGSYTLNANTLAARCYQNMFTGCSGMINPVTLGTGTLTLASYCCHSMFSYCTKITTAPALVANNAVEYCYSYMFSGCSSMTTVTIATGRTSAITFTGTGYATECCRMMFDACSSLSVGTSTATGAKQIIHIPNSTQLGEAFANMFQDTKNFDGEPGYPQRNETWYCYVS